MFAPSCQCQATHHLCSRFECAEEVERRARQEIETIQKKQQMDDMVKLMVAAGQSVSNEEDFKNVDLAALEAEVREKARKAKDEEARRKTEQAKRLDFLIRALRESERPKVDAFAQQVYEADLKYVNDFNRTEYEKAVAKHVAAKALKPVLVKMLPYTAEWEDKVLEHRRLAYEAERVSVLVH